MVDSCVHPVYLRALEQGADFVLHSATKFPGRPRRAARRGRVQDEDDYEQLLQFRSRSGIVAAPDAAWLLRRSLETLELRMRRHTENATEIARRLQAHRAVERVRYPGFGGLLSFDVAGGAEAAQRVEQSVRAIKDATSLGGTRSVLETRARWEGDRVPENLVRLSVGLEDAGESGPISSRRSAARKGRRRGPHDDAADGEKQKRKQQRCPEPPPRPLQARIATPPRSSPRAQPRLGRARMSPRSRAADPEGAEREPGPLHRAGGKGSASK